MPRANGCPRRGPSPPGKVCTRPIISIFGAVHQAIFNLYVILKVCTYIDNTLLKHVNKKYGNSFKHPITDRPTTCPMYNTRHFINHCDAKTDVCLHIIAQWKLECGQACSWANSIRAVSLLEAVWCWSRAPIASYPLTRVCSLFLQPSLINNSFFIMLV